MSLAEREDMKIEEAIKYLKMATDEAENEEFSDKYKEMCNMSIKALEKQIPKKMESYYCPDCRHYFEDGEEHNYCPSCGQRLII